VSDGRRKERREKRERESERKAHHRSDLGEEVLLSDEPQVLRVPLRGSINLRHDTGSVIGSESDERKREQGQRELEKAR